MLKKTLIIIGSREDKQAFIWENICKNSGIDCVFFEINDLNIGWYIEIHNTVPVLKSKHYASLQLNDHTLCWYLRGPLDVSLEVLQIINVLHHFLSWFAYPLGNYFQCGLEEAAVESKLTQSQFIKHIIPQTFVYSTIPKNIKPMEKITKSISSIRSTVVNLNDKKLRNCNDPSCVNTHCDLSIGSKEVCPVQVQSCIKGKSVKAHFYKNRRGAWIGLCILSESSEIDYRYASWTQHQLIPMPAQWFFYADKCFELFQSKFFDMDFIMTEQGDDYFLEINFSPAPVFFEKNIWNDRYHYSALVLNDWLC